MEGASTSRDPSKPNPKVVSNAKELFKVLHDESLLSQDKLKQIRDLMNDDDVDINFHDKNDDCNTLLHGAASYGYVDIVKLILNKTKFDVSEQKVSVNVQKVKVNIQNAKGETPLHLVLSDRRINRNKCSKAIVQLLLICKADVNIKNSDDKTLLDLAYEKKEEALISFLEGKQVQEVTDAFAKNKKTKKTPETYESSGAKDSMHGTVYQLRLLMLFAIRALVKGYRFHLGTEVKEAEQFDDLVFEYRLPNTDPLKKLFLQAKSKANDNTGIGLKELLDEDNKAEFSLLKYYKSFIKIRESEGQKADKFDFAICTNTHFKFDEIRVLIGNDIKLSFELVTDMCEGFLKEGQCYKLKIDEETLKWLKIDFAQKLDKEKNKLKHNDKKREEYDNILSCLNDTHSDMMGTFETFLNKLVFVVGHSADIELVKTEFKEYSKINLLDTKLQTDAFYKQIFDWFSQKEGVWLTNGMVEEIIGSICDSAFATSVSQVYVEKSRMSNIKFNTGKLEELNERISGNKIINLITPVDTKLTLLQVAQALEFSSAYKANGFVFIHFSSLLLSETQERTLRAFESPRNNNLLVIDCLSDKKYESAENLTTLNEKLRDITTKNTRKKIILISEENHALAEMFRLWPEYYSEHVKHVFNDFTKETQDVFLATKVKFQGQRIELKQVICETETELLQIVPLETLISDEGLVIGKDQLASSGYNKSYYIDRSLTYQTVIKANIFQDKLDGKFKDEITKTEHEFQSLCSTHPEANIHLIEKQDDRLIWFKSKGELTALRSYIDNDNTKACSEALFLDFVKQQRVVIISDSAGMGKSTVLDHISEKIKDKDQGTLVLRIELNKHTKALQKKIEKTERNNFFFDNLSAMDFLLDLDIITTNNLERELLKRNGKAVVMFDGFDEISPNYNELVLEFIQHLVEATEAQIWITTRPFMTADLEIKLHQFSYTLKAFSKSNQIEFLTKYWKQTKSNQNLEEGQIKIFAESIINKISESINDKERKFTGIPLQMRMVAEIFDDDLTHSTEVEKIFNCVDLYDKFIEKKRKVFYSEKNCSDDSKVGVEEEQKKTFKIYKKLLRRIALTVIFPDNIVNLLQPSSKKEKYSEERDARLNRIGIVNVIDGKPYFIHRTFAEYFVAVQFIKFLNKQEHLNEEQFFMCIDILKSENYKVIRAFINGLLAKVQNNEVSKRPFEKLFGTSCDEVFSDKHKQIKQCILLTAEEGYDQIFLNLSNYVQAQPITLREQVACTTEDYGAMLYKAAWYNNHAYIKTLLQWARDNMGQEIVRLMLLTGNKGGDTALMRASYRGHNAVVQSLLQWTRDNMDQDIVRVMLLTANKDGDTALMIASYEGRNDVVKTLLQGTRDNMGQEILRLMLIAVNAYGDTALMIASYQGLSDVVQTLLQWTRDNMDQELVRLMLLATDEDCDTALMIASYLGHNDVVETLLQWTRDNTDEETLHKLLTARNNNGRTALDLAERRHKAKCVKILKKYSRPV